MFAGIGRLLAICSAAVLGGCFAADVGPINSPVGIVTLPPTPYAPNPGDDGSVMVGLSFSGGGMRASSFSYGVLRELDEIVIDEHPYTRTLLDDVRMISGTSGGSVMAAYFGYRGREGYRDFPDKFLSRNVEASMSTSTISPVNLGKALAGGVNDRKSFARWLDENLFSGATFASLRRRNAPVVWITATDIFNGTPFVFNHDTFAALCSDLDRIRLADAVAASSAVPVVFRPHVLEAGGASCAFDRPDWMKRALSDPQAPLRLQAYARSLETYHDSLDHKYLKLLDGGLTDNIGVTGFAMERAGADNAHDPLTAEEAVKLKTLFYIVADAGRQPAPEWGGRRTGPKLRQLVPTLFDTAITSSMRQGYDALDLAVEKWRDELIGYRCGLPSVEVRRLRGTLQGWDCHDIEIITEHLSFRSLDGAAFEEMNDVPTRLRLPQATVDKVIAAGRVAVRSNPRIREAVARIQNRTNVNARY